MNLCDISFIRRLLARHNFHIKKGFGQNFLINAQIPKQIAALSGADPGSGVLEIGPGIGCLTQELSKASKRVVAVEIDKRLSPVLSETLADCGNVDIVYGDFMELDIHKLIDENFGGMDVYVCANLPYYITTPIIMRLLEERLPIKSVTVMVQREVALRLCADESSRDNGAISLSVRYFSTPVYLFDVPAADFFPAPKVDSAVIRLDMLDKPGVSVLDEELLFKIIKASFSQRRKTLSNSLSNTLGLSKTLIERCLLAIGKENNIRGERMSLQDFAAFCDLLKNEGIQS